MGKDGGTQLWCPSCESIQVCRVDTDFIDSDESKGNVFWEGVPKIRSFRRPRVCNKCGEFFWTDEVNENWLVKLIDYEKLSDAYSLEGLQKEISAFAIERDWEQFHSIRNLVLALVGEVGELAAEFQWLNDEQVESAMLDTQKREAIGSELADILAYLIRIADVAQFDLESELMKKMQVNESRYPIEKSKGSSAKYTAYD